MTERRIPVAEPVLGQEELDNVVAAIRSGWISSLGAFIPEFECEFAAFEALDDRFESIEQVLEGTVERERVALRVGLRHCVAR